MSKRFITLAAGMLLAFSAQAQTGGGYISLAVGQSSWNEDCTGIAQCDTKGNAVRLLGGYELGKSGFALEGFVLDLGKITGRDSGVNVSIKGQAVGLGAAFGGEFSPGWRGALRFGLASVMAKGTGTGLGLSVSDSTTSTQGLIGLGLSYAITPGLYAELNYDGTRVKFVDQTENVSAWTIGLGWRF